MLTTRNEQRASRGQPKLGRVVRDTTVAARRPVRAESGDAAVGRRSGKRRKAQGTFANPTSRTEPHRPDADPVYEETAWTDQRARAVCTRGYAVIPGHLPLTSVEGTAAIVDTVLSHAETVVAMLADHHSARFHANLFRCGNCQALTVRVDAIPSLQPDERPRCGACGSEHVHLGATYAGA